MSESDVLAGGTVSDVTEVIAGLRQSGSEQFDPVRFHYLESLARRMLEQPENVRRVLHARLSDALAKFTNALEPTGSAAMNCDVADAVNSTPLGELVAYIAEQSEAPASGRLDDGVIPHGRAAPELKSIRQFRSTWSKLSVHKQVTQAIEQAPDNAGPLNSHMLVLRSLATMREISPDYLNRFMSYVDTLLCLDHADQVAKLPVKKPRAVKAAKK